MYPVNEGDKLVKVSRYELLREGKCLDIVVSHSLAGFNAGKFEAVILCDGCSLSDEFWCVSTSEGSALRECLLLIQGLSLKQLLDRGAWSPPFEG